MVSPLKRRKDRHLETKNEWSLNNNHWDRLWRLTLSRRVLYSFFFFYSRYCVYICVIVWKAATEDRISKQNFCDSFIFVCASTSCLSVFLWNFSHVSTCWFKAKQDWGISLFPPCKHLQILFGQLVQLCVF